MYYISSRQNAILITIRYCIPHMGSTVFYTRETTFSNCVLCCSSSEPYGRKWRLQFSDDYRTASYTTGCWCRWNILIGFIYIYIYHSEHYCLSFWTIRMPLKILFFYKVSLTTSRSFTALVKQIRFVLNHPSYKYNRNITLQPFKLYIVFIYKLQTICIVI